MASGRTSNAAPHGRKATPPWLSLAVFLTTAIVFSSAAVLGGCGCKRQPEWDSGLRATDQPEPTQRGGADVGNGEKAGDGGGDGSGNGSGESSTGGQGQGGQGQGDGEGSKGAGKGQGEGGEGSGPAGASGDSAGGAAGGGEQDGGATVAGSRAGEAAGIGTDPTQPPAALPGRPRPKPRYDSATAAAVAERHLKRAASHRSDGDLGNAYADAIQAFEAVEPHATSDDACKHALARARTMLQDLAERQNRKPIPRATPSYLE
jgi:hypothetical protein